MDRALQHQYEKSMKVSGEVKCFQWVGLEAVHLGFTFLEGEMAGCTKYTDSWILAKCLAE